MRLLLLFLIPLLTVSSQAMNPDEDKTPGFSLKPHYGFIIIHSRDIVAVKESYPKGLMFEAFSYNSGKDIYDQCACSARTGISAAIWDFDSPGILGRGVDLSIFLEPVFRINNSMNFSFKGAAGASYLNMPYDPVTNPNNLSYSTRFSFNLSTGVHLNVAISTQTQLQLAANYNHISNGGIKEPNKGINYPTASVGIIYFTREPMTRRHSRKAPEETIGHSDRLSLHVSGTNKQVELKRYYPIAGFAVQYMKTVSRLNALGVEFDWVWHGANDHIARNEEIQGNALSFGLGAGNEFMMGKFLFQQFFGVYLKKSVVETKDIYQRYGLSYKAGKHLRPGIGLRAHGHVADFLDLRIGWDF
jgi:hypothetical protein